MLVLPLLFLMYAVIAAVKDALARSLSDLVRVFLEVTCWLVLNLSLISVEKVSVAPEICLHSFPAVAILDRLEFH